MSAAPMTLPKGWMRASLPKLGEHREDIQRALRAARIRPQPKGCYSNAARLVVEQSEVPLEYVEGLVESSAGGMPIAHAWVRTSDGADHDITLRHAPVVRAVLVLDARATAERMSLGYYGPWADLDGAIAELMDCDGPSVDGPSVMDGGAS